MPESEQVKGSSVSHHRTGLDGRKGLQCHLSCIQPLKEKDFHQGETGVGIPGSGGLRLVIR